MHLFSAQTLPLMRYLNLLTIKKGDLRHETGDETVTAFGTMCVPSGFERLIYAICDVGLPAEPRQPLTRRSMSHVIASQM